MNKGSEEKWCGNKCKYWQWCGLSFLCKIAARAFIPGEKWYERKFETRLTSNDPIFTLLASYQPSTTLFTRSNPYYPSKSQSLWSFGSPLFSDFCGIWRRASGNQRCGFRCNVSTTTLCVFYYVVLSFGAKFQTIIVYRTIVFVFFLNVKLTFLP